MFKHKLFLKLEDLLPLMGIYTLLAIAMSGLRAVGKNNADINITTSILVAIGMFFLTLLFYSDISNNVEITEENKDKDIFVFSKLNKNVILLLEISYILFCIFNCIKPNMIDSYVLLVIYFVWQLIIYTLIELPNIRYINKISTYLSKYELNYPRHKTLLKSLIKVNKKDVQNIEPNKELLEISYIINSSVSDIEKMNISNEEKRKLTDVVYHKFEYKLDDLIRNDLSKLVEITSFETLKENIESDIESKLKHLTDNKLD